VILILIVTVDPSLLGMDREVRFETLQYRNVPEIATRGEHVITDLES
jgi:hypothetical protein